MMNEVDLPQVPDESRLIASVAVVLIEPPEGPAVLTHSRGFNVDMCEDPEMTPEMAINLLEKVIESLKEEANADDVV